MSIERGKRSAWQGRALWMWGCGLMALGLVLAVAAGDAAAQRSDPERKMKREITVFENILDQVVIDSRNVIVPSRHSVHGTYLPEFGVMFTTEANLLFRDWDFGGNWANIEKKGDLIIIHRDSWDDDDDGDDKGSGKDRRSVKQRRTERAVKLYKDAKEELTDALMDYGDTMSSLRDDQSVGITVYLGDDDYFQDRKISRLLIKAKMADIRAFAAGRLSRQAMESRLVEEEY